MLIIFDVDGTLIGGESFDWASFDAALAEVAGFAPEPGYWESLEEVTAQAIAVSACAAHPVDKRSQIEARIRAGYLRNLALAHQANPTAFRPRPGVPELLKALRGTKNVSVAIATGDWFETISLKLEAAGLDIRGIPMATCSDCCHRADIIKLAASRAGRALSDAVYVGDGTWDLLACRKLGIPFIGTGERPHRLRAAGALHLAPDLSPELFWKVWALATAPNALQPIACKT